MAKSILLCLFITNFAAIWPIKMIQFSLRTYMRWSAVKFCTTVVAWGEHFITHIVTYLWTNLVILGCYADAEWLNQVNQKINYQCFYLYWKCTPPNVYFSRPLRLLSHTWKNLWHFSHFSQVNYVQTYLSIEILQHLSSLYFWQLYELHWVYSDCNFNLVIKLKQYSLENFLK